MQKLFILLTLLSITPSSWAQHKPVSYQFKVTDAAHHLAVVGVTFPDVDQNTLEVKLPVWRSGRYEILDLSKNISDFSAHDNNGQTIEWHKTDKNTWQLQLKHPGDVTISYQAYANHLKERVVHIDTSHAYLDASGIFMFAPSYRDQPLTVDLNVPEGWQSRSGMQQLAPHRFKAEDYDQLVDSPIETGIHEFLAFEVEDKQYEIVIWGEGNHDINDLKKQVTLMHHEAKKIWGDFPFDRYVYMYHAGDGLRGATEHVNSTIIQQQRFNFKPRKSYLKVLATTAHEFVHTWNVKAYRPAGIAPYNYSSENYSELFWMAEGITSYYDDLLLMRAGIYEPKEYFKRLAENIEKHLDKPGRHVESLAQTSFDTWLKDNTQRSHNASVSIYLEGSLAAWLLDQEIRQRTNNKYGLDRLQKLLYQRHSNIDQGYTKTDVLQLLTEITGSDMTAFWRTYIEGTQAIDFDQLLDFYGLQKVTQAQEPSPAAWIGAALSFEPGQVVIKTVDSGGPAWQAGLTAGDQLLAINGIQVNEQNINERIQQLVPGEALQWHYFNAGRLRETSLTPIADPHPKFTIKAVDKPSRKQKARFKAWTGQDLAN